MSGKWTLRLDGALLVLAGTAALVSDTVGHFLGVGPLAKSLGSPYTIGSFEAHGLAIIIGLFLLGANARVWHWMGLAVHVLLGTANLIFWNSFVQLGVIPVGIVTTVLHGVFVCAQTISICRQPVLNNAQSSA